MNNHNLHKSVFSVVAILMLDSFIVLASEVAGANTNLKDSNRPGISVSKRTKLYIPPPGKDVPKTATRPTGRRNGCDSKQTTFRVLAPYQHIGRTHMIWPSFSWYVPDNTVVPMKFQLYQDRHSSPLLDYDFESSQGIMTITIPKEELNLSIGKKYWWQVILYCTGRSQPSGSRRIGAELEVVSPSASMLSRLAIAKGPVERAMILAAAGFWYDALAEVSKGKTLREKQIQDILLEDLEHLERDFEGKI